MANHTRRSVLGMVGAGALGAAAGAAGGVHLGRSRLLSDIALITSPSPKVDGIIDTHHHLLPQFYLQAVGEAAVAALTPYGAAPVWTPEIDLEVMDEYKIRKAVLSASVGLGTGTIETQAALARQLNDYGATLVRDHPTRYGYFAILPLPDIDLALKEAAYALDTLKANGLIIFSNYNGAYLGEAQFEPLWQELNRRKAVVFIHPTSPVVKVTDIPNGILEFVFDTTRTAATLIYSGATQKYPDIKFILSHGGGTVPYLSMRIDGLTRLNPTLAKILPNGAGPELKKFYWDTALTFDATAMKSLLTLADPSKVMFGTDFPFAPKTVLPISLKSLNGQLPPETLETVLHGSALRIMPELA